MGMTATKTKKCRWVDDKRPKNLASNHLIEARLASHSTSIQDAERIILKPQKSETNFDK